MMMNSFKNPQRNYYFEKKQDTHTTPKTIKSNDTVLDAVYTTWKRAYAVGEQARPEAEKFLAEYLPTLPDQMNPLELIIKIPTTDGTEEGNVVELCVQHAQNGALVKAAVEILCDNRHRQYERASQLLLENHQVVYASPREQDKVVQLINTARKKAAAAVIERAERAERAAAQAAIDRATREAEVAAQSLARRAAREAAAERTVHQPLPPPVQRRRAAAPARRFSINPRFLVMALLALLALVVLYVSSGKELNTLQSSARGSDDRSEDFLKRLWEGRPRRSDMEKIIKHTKLTSDQMTDVKTITALVNLINDNTFDAMLTQVLLALAHVIEVRPSVDVTYSSETGCQALVKAGIINRLMDSLSIQRSHLIDLQILSMIANLAASKAGAQAMTTSNFIEKLMVFLATTEPPVKAQALRTIANLAKQSESSLELLIQGRAIPTILAALEWGNANIHQAGLPALINLIRSNAAAAEVVRANGVEIIGVFLHSADFFIQQNAAIAFKNLATYNAGAAAIKGNEKVYRALNTLALSGNSIVQPHASDAVKSIFVYSMNQPGAPRLPFAEQHPAEQPATPGLNA